MTRTDFDVAILGGGLAGLSLSILLAQQGLHVAVFEQKTYPFHRVCGEYVAMESWDFLQRLGLNLAKQRLPRITRLQVTTPTQSLESPLAPGGFGISRYQLDWQLAAAAREAGVQLYTGTRVQSITTSKTVHTSAGVFRARLLCGAFGKHSNLDTQLRPEQLPPQTGEPTFVGIKYHLNTRFPKDLIALHNFAGGYCGISTIEAERVCCCYLVSQETLTKAGGVAALEDQILSQNPYLASIFAHATFCWDKPQAIAQVYFSPRRPLPGAFPLGDAAGLIPPLCGNGMSMAFRSADLLAPLVCGVLSGTQTESEALQRYAHLWQNTFGQRMMTGRFLQKHFGHLWPINSLLNLLRPVPRLRAALIARTHGAPF